MQSEDIEPLTKLTGLKYLDLTGNELQFVEPLKNLTGLNWLYLNGNELQSIEPLTNLTGLTELHLDEKWKNNYEILCKLIENNSNLNINLVNDKGELVETINKSYCQN